MSKRTENLKFLIRVKESKYNSHVKAIERIEQIFIYESREGKNSLSYSKQIHENKMENIRSEISKLQSALSIKFLCT